MGWEKGGLWVCRFSGTWIVNNIRGLKKHRVTRPGLGSDWPFRLRAVGWTRTPFCLTDPEPDLVPDPSSIAGTDGTEERGGTDWSAACGGAGSTSLLIDGPGTGLVPEPSCSSGTGGTEKRMENETKRVRISQSHLIIHNGESCAHSISISSIPWLTGSRVMSWPSSAPDGT